MTQRTVACPKCAANIAIPGGYAKVGIYCTACRTPVDLRTGGVYQKHAKPLPTAPATPPRAATPAAPAGLELVSDQPALRPRPSTLGVPLGNEPLAEEPAPRSRLMLWLVLAAIVVLGGGGGLTFYLLRQARETAEKAVLNAKWIVFESPDGWFSIEMPDKAETTNRARPGGTEHVASAAFNDTRWEISYFDLGSGPTNSFPFDTKAESVSQGAKLGYTVEETRARNLIFCEGSDSSFAGNGLARVFVLRRGNRIYSLSACGLTANNIQAAERFLTSMKLGPVVYPSRASEENGVKVLLPDGPLPAPVQFKYSQPPVGTLAFFEGERASGKVEIFGGTPSYSINVINPKLPGGLTVETPNNDCIVVAGATLQAGDYELAFTVLDAAGFEIAGKLAIRVDANPFVVKMDPPPDQPGRVTFILGDTVNYMFTIEGPGELLASGEWYVPWLPTGLAHEVKPGGVLVSGMPLADTNNRIEIEWTGKGKSERVYKSRYSFQLLEVRPFLIVADPKPADPTQIVAEAGKPLKVTFHVEGDLAVLEDAGSWSTKDLPAGLAETVQESRLVVEGTLAEIKDGEVQVTWKGKRKAGREYVVKYYFKFVPKS